MTSPAAAWSATPVPLARTFVTSAALFVGYALLAISCFDYAYNGDVIVYANIIGTRSFDALTIHQGYFLLVWLLQQALAPWANLPTEVVMVWIAPLFGAASLVVVYHLAQHFLTPAEQRASNTASAARPSEVWFCVAAVALSYRFFVNSSSAEIYMPQTFGILLSYLLFARGRPTLASLPLLFALHVSPLTAFWCAFFPMLVWQRRLGWAPLLRLAIPTAAIYLPFFAYYANDLLWGTRGLLAVQDVQPFVPGDALRNLFAYQFKHYTLGLALLVPALLALRAEREILLLTLAVFLPNLLVLVKLEGEDNVFILTFDFFIGLWLTLGLRELTKRGWAKLGYLALLLHLGLQLYAHRPWAMPDYAGYGAELRSTAQRITRENARLVAHWDQQVGLVYFGRTTGSYPLERGALYDRMLDPWKLPATFAELVDGYDALYLYDRYSPSPLTQLLRSEQTQREIAAAESIAAWIEKRYRVRCTMVASGVRNLYQCPMQAAPK